MKEFIDKLISRLEELKKIEQNRSDDCDEEGYGDAEQIFDDGRSQGRYEQTRKIISIVNELAEEYKVSEMPTGWIPCSSGEMPKCGEFDVKKVWVTMHRKGIDFYFTKRICWNNYLKCWEWSNGKKMADDWEVIAWMYTEVPAPYTEEK